MRVLIADDVLTFSLFEQKVSTNADFLSELIMFVKKIFLMMVQIKKTFYRNEVLFLQSVITSEWLL